jgi:hypothetical protein
MRDGTHRIGVEDVDRPAPRGPGRQLDAHPDPGAWAGRFPDLLASAEALDEARRRTARALDADRGTGELDFADVLAAALPAEPGELGALARAVGWQADALRRVARRVYALDEVPANKVVVLAHGLGLDHVMLLRLARGHLTANSREAYARAWQDEVDADLPPTGH